MTVTLTMDPTLSRVRIDATALSLASLALVERSIDLVTWTTVRQGVAAPVVAGALSPTLDDYEFVPGVVNHYRVRGFGPPGFVAAGTAAHADNAAVSPGIPAGTLGGDQMFLLAACRNSGTGTVDTPAGWGLVQANGNMAIFRRTAAGTVGLPTSDTSPTVTFSGTVAGVTTSAVIWTVRNLVTPDLVTVPGLLNGSAQNIAYPQVDILSTLINIIAFLIAWKQDDWTSVAPPAGWVEIAESSSVLGDDQGIYAAYLRQSVGAMIPGGSIVVTGGAAAISRSDAFVYGSDLFHNDQTGTITPTLDRVWLKSPARPFLNRRVTVVGFSAVERPARSSDHDVVGRSYPVAVSDVRGSRRWALELYTATADDAQTMDYVLASGDVLFVQAPHGCSVPGGYVRVGDTAERRPSQHRPSRVFTLPCVEVVPPGPDVGGAEGTWASVLAAYATWADVLAAFPTWADLLALVGEPSEVIVP